MDQGPLSLKQNNRNSNQSKEKLRGDAVPQNTCQGHLWSEPSIGSDILGRNGPDLPVL